MSPRGREGWEEEGRSQGRWVRKAASTWTTWGGSARSRGGAPSRALRSHAAWPSPSDSLVGAPGVSSLAVGFQVANKTVPLPPGPLSHVTEAASNGTAWSVGCVWQVAMLAWLSSLALNVRCAHHDSGARGEVGACSRLEKIMGAERDFWKGDANPSPP